MARTQAEERYLDGRHSLFPDIAAASEEQVHDMRQSAAMAILLAEFDGAETPTEPRVEDRVASLVADLVEPCKAMALEKLGEGARGLPIAVSWLRSKYDRSADGQSGRPAADVPTL